MEPPDAAQALVTCPRCEERVVTVELRLERVVFWRCVRCGHLFAQRVDSAPPPAGT